MNNFTNNSSSNFSILQSSAFTAVLGNQPAQSLSTVEIDMLSVERAIRECVMPSSGSRREAVFTVKEIADRCHLNTRNVYYRLDGATKWGIKEVIELLHLSVEKGGSPLLDLIMPAGSLILHSNEPTDGCIRDEVIEQIEVTGEMVTAVNSNNLPKAIGKLRRITQILARAGRELRLMLNSRIERGRA